MIFVENVTLPETNSWHLKMYGWNTSFLLGWPIFRGELLVLGSVLPKNLGRDSLDSTTGGVKTNQQGNLS